MQVVLDEGPRRVVLIPSLSTGSGPAMPRPVRLSAFILGFTSLLTQIVAARELLTSFLGNEISIAIILLVWLGLVAIGSGLGAPLFASRAPAVLIPWLHCAAAASVMPAIWIAQASGGIGEFQGQVIGPVTMLLLATVALFAPCLVLGAVFATLCRSGEGEDQERHVASVYAVEAGGAVVAGIAFHFLIADHVGSSQAMALIAALNLGTAAALWRGSGRWIAAVASAAFAALAIAPLGGFGLDAPGLARRWRGVEVRAEGNSRYGNIAVVDIDGQLSLYEAGLPALTGEDVQHNEAAVHLPMLLHDDPKSILMVSGGLGGGLVELLKHPVERVDYVEMDPKLLDLAREHAGALLTGLDDSRVTTHHVDGRAYVKTCRRHYDVVLVLVPDPATTALSRFYTREFFGEVSNVLADGGLLAVGLTAAQARLTGPRQHLHASVYEALRATYRDVAAIPGDYTQYIASDRPALAETRVLVDRLDERNIHTGFLNEVWLDHVLGPFQRDQLQASLRSAGDVPANRDARPVSSHYWLRLWLSERAHWAGAWLESAPRAIRWTWALVPLALLAALAIRRRGNAMQIGAGLCIFGTGFLEMGAQLSLVMAYQAVAGYLYHRIGILMALFMLGLALGAMLGRRLGRQHVHRTLIGAVLLQAASAAYLPLLFLLARGGALVADVVFAAGAGWMGFPGGLNFPLAVAVVARHGQEPAVAASRLYAIDLAGASLGAVLIGAIAIPAVGVGASCQALAFLLVAAVVPLALASLRGK